MKLAIVVLTTGAVTCFLKDATTGELFLTKCLVFALIFGKSNFCQTFFRSVSESHPY